MAEDLIARMVHLAKGSGAKVVGLNVPLLDEERNAALREIRTLREQWSAYALSRRDDEVADWVQENLKEREEKANHDLALLEAVKEAGNVILPAMTRLPAGQVKGKWSQETLLSRDCLSEKDPSAWSRETRTGQELHLLFQGLAEAATGFGHDDFLAASLPRASPPLFISITKDLFSRLMPSG